jgi:hypothetical protein
VTYRPETSLLPNLHEKINPGPPVEGNKERIGFEDPVHFTEGGAEPVSIRVVEARPPISWMVIYEIWWIDDYEVNTVTGNIW